MNVKIYSTYSKDGVFNWPQSSHSHRLLVDPELCTEDSFQHWLCTVHLLFLGAPRCERFGAAVRSKTDLSNFAKMLGVNWRQKLETQLDHLFCRTWKAVFCWWWEGWFKPTQKTPDNPSRHVRILKCCQHPLLPSPATCVPSQRWVVKTGCCTYPNSIPTATSFWWSPLWCSPVVPDFDDRCRAQWSVALRSPSSPWVPGGRQLGIV